MKINNLWRRLDALVPEPQCRTFDDEYDLIQWNDVRPLPTISELQALTQAQVDARTEERRDFDVKDLTDILVNKNILKVMDIPDKAKKLK